MSARAESAPAGLVELAARAREIPKDRPIVAVCRAGSRSAHATAILQKAGFSDVAILSYRLVSYAKKPDGSEFVAAKWNSTQVFRRASGAWKTVHVHWSFTQPELKNPPKGPA